VSTPGLSVQEGDRQSEAQTGNSKWNDKECSEKLGEIQGKEGWDRRKGLSEKLTEWGGILIIFISTLLLVSTCPFARKSGDC
jgi:hypothetical protein